ncbi:MAG TPA: DEAD/DEAH box helicase [Bryobacteraceae bacterium]|nr:DEAD/DEAH box helicase [Bryobacteraceae bacterium]
MKLSSALASQFDVGVRSRGASYFRSGAVRIERGSDTEVEAKVRGSRTYDVDITWDGRSLGLFCDCPYFETGGPCKHLWATILAADAKDYISKITRFDPRSVRLDRDAEAEGEDEDFGGGDDFDGEDEDDPTESLDYRGPGQRYHQLPSRTALPAPKPAFVPQPPQPAWKRQLPEVPSGVARASWPVGRELQYLVKVSESAQESCVVVHLSTREPKRGGGWKPLGPLQATRDTIGAISDPLDREIVGLLAGCSNHQEWYGLHQSIPSSYRLQNEFAAMAMPLIAGTGRCSLYPAPGTGEEVPLVWDDGEPWRFHLRLTRPAPGKYAVTGCLRRGDEEMGLQSATLVAGGLVFTGDRIARLADGAPKEWISALRRTASIEAQEEELNSLLTALIEHPVAVPLELPEDLRYEEVQAAPRPCLTIRTSRRNEWEQERMRGELSFEYMGTRIPSHHPGKGIFDAALRRYTLRDESAEQAAKAHLVQLGLTEEAAGWQSETPTFRVAPKRLPEVVRACVEAGWHIEAEGKTFRRPGAMNVRVSSGVDWFELHGEVDYGGFTARLPALLAALRRGENVVRLDDGTYGLLPEEWLSRFGHFASVGTAEDDHLRFRRNQTGVLDALLAAQPEINCDEAFSRARDELQSFAGISSGEQPAGFVGQLREYQRDGLAWMEFLRRFGFGGCLADDMGVGKTAQVLAQLEARRASHWNGGSGGPGGPGGPSLVVVPKSLVFNWKQEAARFTPQLRVLDHTGLSRDASNFADYDLILTTYGTLRRDAAEFKDVEFDYIVLDEAQAIKNPNTESAKAARLLRGRYRLALSGTPVENHLGELWSIFEFLNPGMLGAARVLKLAGVAGRNPNVETRKMLAHALRPFILRRTKEQVARELPAKSEQTIFCELEPPQRKLYNELRAHYRNKLLSAVDARGLAKSKIQVLEALLRLRQAACHPGLLDPKRTADASAKLDMLIDRLAEIVDEGHKALVFSQFTSMLAIVQDRLEAAGIEYEYLDGSTTDRQKHVEHFQTDPACGVFLISLKAGGLGLNLTAAEYVFLLDPWWNPAVEAQAVDRAHRIGQTQQVFAYRLIARDTVEEKVLELQNSKRELVAAIIGEDNSLIRNLQREDLELLLS